MPPEVEPILRDPEVIEAMVAVVIAVLTTVAALLGLGVKKLRDLQKATKAIDYQVVNSHGPDGKDVNLRDQIDRVEATLSEGFRRMDHQFGEVHDRQIVIERRIEGVETNAREEHARIWKAVESYDK